MTNGLAPVSVRWRQALLARPAVGVALAPVNVIIASSAAALALLLHVVVVAIFIVAIDIVAIAAYVANPRRRGAFIRQQRRRNRGLCAHPLRDKDARNWRELEQMVVAIDSALSPFSRDELDRLLDLFVEVGCHAARWERHLERLTKLPTRDDDAPLVAMRTERRARAVHALETFTAQLTTLASLIELACEDAVAQRAWTAAGSTTTQVEEASRTAQLAIAAAEDGYSPWEMPTLAKT